MIRIDDNKNKNEQFNVKMRIEPISFILQNIFIPIYT